MPTLDDFLPIHDEHRRHPPTLIGLCNHGLCRPLRMDAPPAVRWSWAMDMLSRERIRKVPT